jgi:hypothetical protein
MPRMRSRPLCAIFLIDSRSSSKIRRGPSPTLTGEPTGAPCHHRLAAMRAIPRRLPHDRSTRERFSQRGRTRSSWTSAGWGTASTYPQHVLQGRRILGYRLAPRSYPCPRRRDPVVRILTEEERTAFQRLIAISGIGPKIALCSPVGSGVADMERAVREGDRGCSSEFRDRPEDAERVPSSLWDRLSTRTGRGAGRVRLTARGVRHPFRRPDADAISALVHPGYPMARRTMRSSRHGARWGRAPDRESAPCRAAHTRALGRPIAP